MLEETKDFVAPVIGLDEGRVRLDVVNEPLLVRAEFEIPIRLRELHHLAVARGEGAVGQAFLLGDEGLFLRGVKPIAAGLVEVPLGMELREDGLDNFLVARLRGADEVVVREAELGDEGLPAHGQLIAIGLRGFAVGLRGLLDLLPVFIETGEEEDLLAQRATAPGDDIRDDLLVGMAEVRLTVHVINRGRDVETFAHRAADCAGRTGGRQRSGGQVGK